MEGLFISIFNLSYQAGIVICVLILARWILALVKAPKKYAYYLWGIAFIRMICPIQLESIFSLMPQETKPLGSNIMYESSPGIYTGNLEVNQLVGESLPAAEPTASINPMQMIMFAGTCIWLAGIVLILLYSIVSYVKLKSELVGSIPWKKEEKGNVYLADHLDTAFVLGIIKPIIYLPSDLSEREMLYVLQHEKAHIKRRDYMVKPLIFFITVIHWFNPLAWAAFALAIKDMEMSCDEYVIRTAGEDIRKEYASTLMNLSVGRKHMGIPLAFGEGNVSKRIKNVMRCKKPLAVVGICAVTGVIVLAVMLLTNPDSVRKNNAALKDSILDIKEDQEEIYLNEIVPFEWTSAYTFAPYVNKDSQEEIIGFSSRKLQESVSEGMMNLVFVNGKEVVASICGYEEQLGYLIEFDNDDSMGKKGYSKISKDQNAVCHITKTGISIELKCEAAQEQELVENKDKAEQQISTQIPITEPVIDLSMGLGADGVILDYAGEDLVIFHGYFGLFVYSINTEGMIGAVDLEPIGCNDTQGENACEIFVSTDGHMVYLHTMNSNIMYAYDVIAQALYKEPYSIEGLDLFEGFADQSVLPAEPTIYRSERVIVFGEGKNTYYGYLLSGSGVLGDLCYVEGDMIVELFKNSTEEQENYKPSISSNDFGMEIKEENISSKGVAYTVYNNTDTTISFGEDYHLKYQENGTWVDVPYIIENWGFNDIGYELPAGADQEIAVDWQWLYGTLQDGVYLLEKNISVETENGIETITLGTQFPVKASEE